MMFTNQQKRAEAERELKQRRHVYPRLVEAGKLTRQKADQQTAIMEEIAADYREREEKEGLL